MKAFYNEKPDKFADVGNGSKLYRFNMVEVPAPSEQGEEARTQWQVDEVTVWEPLSKEKLVKVVLNEQYGQDHELKLLNEYVSAKEEVITGEEAEAAIAAYKTFAAERKALIATVRYDYDHPVTPVGPTSIGLDKKEITLGGGTVSDTITAQVLPAGVEFNLEWESSDEVVAIVDKMDDTTAKVTMNKADGTTIVTAKCGSVVSSPCEVTVSNK